MDSQSSPRLDKDDPGDGDGDDDDGDAIGPAVFDCFSMCALGEE